ncbi:MAG: hypothetical protein ACK6CU_23515, partial [Deltaproteobacteria bacterium]
AALAVVRAALDRRETVTVIAPTREAGRELVRRVASERGSAAAIEPTRPSSLGISKRDELGPCPERRNGFPGSRTSKPPEPVPASAAHSQSGPASLPTHLPPWHDRVVHASLAVQVPPTRTTGAHVPENSLLDGEVIEAISTALRMLLVAMALAAGILVATAAVPPRRSI